LVTGNVHKRGKDCPDTSNVHQIAEQAVLMKYALGSAEQAWNYSGSSNGVDVGYNVCGAEVLEAS
jgi:hypothetical protein